MVRKKAASLSLSGALICTSFCCHAQTPAGGGELLAGGWSGYESGETGEPALEFEVPSHAKDGAGCFATPVASDEPGNMYLVWLDPSASIKVIRRDPNGRVTTAVVEEKAVVDPDHHNASIAMDKRGFLHVVWGMHNSPWK